MFSLYKLIEPLMRGKKKSNETYVSPTGHVEELDQTGRIANQPVPYSVIRDERRHLIYAKFGNSIAHSFWRAQELSLFSRHLMGRSGATMDFGCGDGSLTNCILDNVSAGVDIDETALSVAREYGIYESLYTFEEMKSDIPTGKYDTIFSVSVLEHTTDPKDCLDQIFRALKSGGSFMFSVPNKNFTAHMATLIDEEFANAMNERMYHRNLLSEAEWRTFLEEAGFKIDSFIEFQPLEMTKRYFSLSLLGRRGLGRIPGLRWTYETLFMRQLLNAVDRSISGDNDSGANYLISCTKE